MLCDARANTFLFEYFAGILDSLQSQSRHGLREEKRDLFM